MGLDLQGMTPLLQVFDMATSLRFYCDVLGFTLHMTDNNPTPNHDWVWLKRDGIDLMLNTAYDSDEQPPEPEARRVAAHDDTTLYFGAPDVDAVYAHLIERGIEVGKPKIAYYGMKQIYLHDPDGFGICFQWRADAMATAGAKAK
jgi:catechol 2,3-dioxygenase-like lactoylglutathione lyase family enzyme